MGVEVSHQESIVIGWESRGGEVVNSVVIIGVAFLAVGRGRRCEGRSPRIRTPHLRSVVNPGDQGVGQCGEVQSRLHEDRNVTALRPPPPPTAPRQRVLFLAGR